MRFCPLNVHKRDEECGRCNFGTFKHVGYEVCELEMLWAPHWFPWRRWTTESIVDGVYNDIYCILWDSKSAKKRLKIKIDGYSPTTSLETLTSMSWRIAGECVAGSTRLKRWTGDEDDEDDEDGEVAMLGQDNNKLLELGIWIKSAWMKGIYKGIVRAGSISDLIWLVSATEPAHSVQLGLFLRLTQFLFGRCWHSFAADSSPSHRLLTNAGLCTPAGTAVLPRILHQLQPLPQ